MGKRGRKSAAAQTAPRSVPDDNVAKLPQRPEAPKSLTKAEAERWREYVAEHAADRFTKSDLRLLHDLVKTETLIEQCDEQIASEGQYLESDRGNWSPHPAVLLRDRHSKLVVKLQQALRLCPSSRYEARAQGAKPQKSRKPWET